MTDGETGTQFHAEYQSRVLDPSVSSPGRGREKVGADSRQQKPYLGFIAASAGCLDQVILEHQQAAASKLEDGVKAESLF